MKISKLISQKIAILGFGKEGKSTFHFLQKLGCSDITIHDTHPVSVENISSVTWENYLQWLEKYDTIFVSPGISRYTPELQKVRYKITSQAQIFFDNYAGKVIAITGTKGKSTTSTLIYGVLKNAGFQVKLVGNIGNPVLAEVDLDTALTPTLSLWERVQYDYIVYELSSYMLDWLTKKNYISILLNIYPDHLDWHHGFENYSQAKLNILRWSEHNLIGYQVEKKSQEGIIFGKNGKYRFENGDFFIDDTKVFDDTNITLLGEHNRYNVCAVLWVCDIVWVDFQILKNTLKNFAPLRHRLETVGTFSGITFVDDAISTTPESTIEAIKTFDRKVDTLFLWWTDRGYEYKNLVNFLKSTNIRNIVLFPPSWEKIENLLDENFTVLKTDDMKEAVEFAFSHTQSWKICLLSTAAPSYSLWKNFEEKGDLFQKYIREYETI